MRTKIRSRYPRLLKALRRGCLLTEGEAICVINGQEPEAVCNLGGPKKAMEMALQLRHRL